MKDVIYLAVDRGGVKRMTKNLPSLYKGEIPIKLTLDVAETAFREPVIEKRVTVEDWREGVDIADVEFKETTITEAEAKMIKEQRLERMQEVLEAQGFTASKPAID
jgi:hypothetical protein